jgi:hypothetical protein
MIHEVRPVKWAIAYPDVMKQMFGGKSKAPFLVMMMMGEEKVFNGQEASVMGIFRRTSTGGTKAVVNVRTRMPVAWPGENGLFKGGSHGQYGYGFITKTVIYYDMQREMDVLCMRDHTVKEMTSTFCKVMQDRSMRMYYNEAAAHAERRAAMAMTQLGASRPAIDVKDNTVAQLEALFESVRLDERREREMETEEEEGGAIVGTTQASSERSMWV